MFSEFLVTSTIIIHVPQKMMSLFQEFRTFIRKIRDDEKQGKLGKNRIVSNLTE